MNYVFGYLVLSLNENVSKEKRDGPRITQGRAWGRALSTPRAAVTCGRAAGPSPAAWQTRARVTFSRQPGRRLSSAGRSYLESLNRWAVRGHRRLRAAPHIPEAAGRSGTAGSQTAGLPLCLSVSLSSFPGGPSRCLLAIVGLLKSLLKAPGVAVPKSADAMWPFPA